MGVPSVCIQAFAAMFEMQGGSAKGDGESPFTFCLRKNGNFRKFPFLFRSAQNGLRFCRLWRQNSSFTSTRMMSLPRRAIQPQGRM